MVASSLESKFIALWMQLDNGLFLIPEYQFYPTRRFRFDFVHIESKTAVELEGGVYSHGRHTRGSGFTKDCEKYNLAASDGWCVIRLTNKMIDDGWLNFIVETIKKRSVIRL